MKKYKKGKKVLYVVDEWPDFYGAYTGKVKEVYEDHIIIDVPGISDHLWIDKDNEYMLRL